MILTYKIKHHRDFALELHKAKLVAEYALETKSRTSKDVKDIGLKSAIANQILKKYSNNRRVKRIGSVKLTVPAQAIKVNKDTKAITITCLKLRLAYRFNNDFSKINQIELDTTYAYVSVTVQEPELITPTDWIGVDLNTTGHCAVGACPKTGKVFKLGKQGYQVHKKYAAMRKRLQKKGKYKELKSLKRREHRKVKDLLHKVGRSIVNYAVQRSAGIKMEDLSGIRERAKVAHSFKYALHSWSFYGLKTIIAYKAKLLGIPLVSVDPRYTSKTCSRCGKIGSRVAKVFKCLSCRHVDHADVNASFNIALRH